MNYQCHDCREGKSLLMCAVSVCCFVITICVIAGTVVLCRQALNKTKNDSNHVEQMREQAVQQRRIADAMEKL